MTDTVLSAIGRAVARCPPGLEGVALCEHCRAPLEGPGERLPPP